jgi:energy-coupling factor transport system ATP-binding protein
VAFAAENRGIPRGQMLELIDWALSVVRLSEYRDATADQLSGGQKQRLVIAANLVIRPEILVLDEPTSQLDPIGTLEVFSTLRELNTDLEMTIVVATHKSDQVSEFADRVMVLEKGNLIQIGPPRHVFFQVPRLDRALVHVPELVRLDYGIRQWAGDRAGELGAPDQANATLDEANRMVVKGITAGLLQPSGNYTRGLGRSAPDVRLEEKAEPILDIENVSYRYKKDAPEALSGINLKVEPGEVIAIIGQNGAGKSTLMKCVTGLLKPQVGRIRIRGTDTTQLDAIDVAKLVGLILQNPDNQLFQMSSEEEVAFGLKNLGLPEEEIKRRTDEVLALTGMEEHRSTYPFKLSLGDRRKLAVAAIYAMHPSILVFDEPTTGQDFQGRYQLCDLAIRLNRMGTTIIMITHDMSLVANYTQRTVVMGKGTILLDAPTREVFLHRETLAGTFLEPPPISRLAQLLEPYGVPGDILTVEEMFQVLTGSEPGSDFLVQSDAPDSQDRAFSLTKR